VLRRAIVTQGWELKHHMLILGEKLGEGSYGDVFKGVLKRGKLSSINVAIKSVGGFTIPLPTARHLLYCSLVPACFSSRMRPTTRRRSAS
jgi:hypothetical protein